MRFDKFRSSWQQFKAIRHLEGISEEEILRAISVDEASPTRAYYSTLIKYVMVHSFLLFFCQSC